MTSYFFKLKQNNTMEHSSQNIFSNGNEDKGAMLLEKKTKTVSNVQKTFTESIYLYL